ncbi:MAG: DsbA family oxidoreductase [Actinobacteria bacterium]|nr:DsbA family oxidoreductase [Actinomycetota bacterium]
MTEPIKVDIWSDVQCPWCFIGKRKFEAGVKQFAGEVEVEYHSFELAPDTPVDFEGTPVDYLAKRKGMQLADVEAMLERVTTVASEVGLNFDYGSVHQTNTGKAHELLHFAKAHGKQGEVKERLLSAYFEQGSHLGQIDVLVAIAGEAGLNESDARSALEAGSYRTAVEADMAQAAHFGISGVPFYVIDGKYGISGAQGSDIFASALAEAAATRTS